MNAVTSAGAEWLERRERAAASRRRHTDRLPGNQSRMAPVCNTPLAKGWCILADGHTAGHLPLPVTYPPTPTVIGGAA